jgi:hypothetical protein
MLSCVEDCLFYDLWRAGTDAGAHESFEPVLMRRAKEQP